MKKYQNPASSPVERVSLREDAEGRGRAAAASAVAKLKNGGASDEKVSFTETEEQSLRDMAARFAWFDSLGAGERNAILEKVRDRIESAPQTKDLAYYFNISYTRTMHRDPGGGKRYFAQVEELPGCATSGADPVEALVNLDELKRLWIEDALERGEPIPEPVDVSAKLARLTERKLRRKA